MKTLPKRIFVVLANEGSEDEYLNATTDIESLEHNVIVGVYEQKELLRHKINHSMEPVAKKKS